MLVDCPIALICSVQLSVKSKFPFDSLWMKCQECHLDLNLVEDRNHNNGLLEMEGEVSCRSFSEAQRLQNLAVSDRTPRSEVVELTLMNSPNVCESSSNARGKGKMNQKPQSALSQRRRAGMEYGRIPSISSSDTSHCIVSDVSHSPYSVSEIENEINGGSLVTVNSGGAGLPKYEAHSSVGLGRTLHDFEFNGTQGESKALKKDSSSVGDLGCQDQGESGTGSDKADTVRVLKQSLEEEHAARISLCLELEKERSAAASAADEAMAMILRLQKEKAEIEMETRQYQRVIEEKTAYDEEEMNILKEILVRREREKHFLEKEVKAYRQMILNEDEQLEDDVNDMEEMSEQGSMSPFDLHDDPLLILRRSSESTAKEKMVKDVEKHGCTHDFEKEVSSTVVDDNNNFLKQRVGQKKVSTQEYHPNLPGERDESNREFEEKEMVTMDENASALQELKKKVEVESEANELNKPQGYHLLDKSTVLMDQNQGLNDNYRECQGMTSKTQNTVSCDDENLKIHGTDAEDQRGKNSYSFMLETNPSILDIHVIADKSEFFNDGNENETQILLTDASSDGYRKCGLPFEEVFLTTSCSETEQDIQSQIHSMSAIDDEVLKLESEVGLLRERLTFLQEGKEKLNSVEQTGRGNIQLQVLEGIASQLREIRKLSEPEKAERCASLPPSSSKVSSKKR